MTYTLRKRALLSMIEYYSNLWEQYREWDMLTLDDLEQLNACDEERIAHYQGELLVLEAERMLGLTL